MRPDDVTPPLETWGSLSAAAILGVICLALVWLVYAIIVKGKKSDD